MTGTEFEQKLQKLNPSLYLGETINTEFNKEWYSTGVYIRGFNDREKADLSNSGLSQEDYQKARRQNESPDKYLTWCTWKHIPEGNRYRDTQLVARGWREILLLLSAHKQIDIQKARKVFARDDLGHSKWDKSSHEQKQVWK